MPQWPSRLLDELTASDARARAVAGTLNLDQLNWKPSPGEWSVGQCLEHLAVATELYLPPIGDALAGKPKGATEEIAPGSAVDAGILERYLAAHQSARELVARAADYDVNRIRFKNPFLPLLRFTVGTGLEIISKHAMRHLLQAERVKARPGFPAR